MYTFSVYLRGLTKRHIWNILTDHMTPLGDCLAQSVDYSFCHLGYTGCQQYVQLINNDHEIYKWHLDENTLFTCLRN